MEVSTSGSPERIKIYWGCQVLYAGVELIAQAHLNVKDDSYVIDHNWKGVSFPICFGLEAMTQAVVF